MKLSTDFGPPTSLFVARQEDNDFSLVTEGANAAHASGPFLVAQAGGLSYAQERSGCVALFGDVMNALESLFNKFRHIWENGGSLKAGHPAWRANIREAIADLIPKIDMLIERCGKYLGAHEVEKLKTLKKTLEDADQELRGFGDGTAAARLMAMRKDLLGEDNSVGAQAMQFLRNALKGGAGALEGLGNAARMALGVLGAFGNMFWQLLNGGPGEQRI